MKGWQLGYCILVALIKKGVLTKNLFLIGIALIASYPAPLSWTGKVVLFRTSEITFRAYDMIKFRVMMMNIMNMISGHADNFNWNYDYIDQKRIQLLFKWKYNPLEHNYLLKWKTKPNWTVPIKNSFVWWRLSFNSVSNIFVIHQKSQGGVQKKMENFGLLPSCPLTWYLVIYLSNMAFVPFSKFNGSILYSILFNIILPHKYFILNKL